MGVTTAGDSTGGACVFRRHVLYIPGYDPFPPRRYRELYRTEGAAQAAISGHAIALKPREGATYGWTVAARVEGRAVETEVEVLVWSDLVKGSMGRGIIGTYGQMLRTAWLYIGSGALRRLIRLRKGPMIAALYPVVALVLQAVLALLVAGLVLWLGWGLPWGLGWLLAAGGAWAVLEGFRRLDHRLFVYYLMHDYAFTTVQGGAYPAVLEERLRAFGARVRAALGSGVDEVLVVGHSSGVHLGVSVLAELIREGVRGTPALGFLSLGQAVPMVSFLPGAARLRGDLAFLSQRDELTWVDVTAPGDGCSFALCDPVAVSGVATEGQRWPLILSAAFTQTLSPERWAALRRRYFRLHFQYLCAFDRPGGYDYFRITAGPLTLAERFRGRKASSSRIATPLSPFKDVA
ncbi:hypothetical protein [Tabrizicola sp.]|jgi:hypothetical protein|uniref:hypothetical protein n=1 Tax=Tabrizicola sp. TaxID=2005166 RepID=UPI0025CC0359|nr:hypothetical protein [Tabrizicola sp.]MBY0350421.1 hypothetical protein [Tabrizicola sp.]MDK2774927.1 hypothetical protein [Tabrizicola sp.]